MVYYVLQINSIKIKCVSNNNENDECKLSNEGYLLMDIYVCRMTKHVKHNNIYNSN